VQIGHFLNFLRIFQAKTAVPYGRRDVIVDDVTSSLPAEQFQDGKKPPHQVGADWTVSEVFTIFSSKISIQSDCRDVIDDVIEPTLLSD
jgi:hypothetical protein